MNKSQKLTLIGYCSSLALILATTNLAKAGETSIKQKNSLDLPAAVSLGLGSEKTELVSDKTQNSDKLALSTGSSDKKTTDGKGCACMGYSNFCLNCDRSSELVG